MNPVALRSAWSLAWAAWFSGGLESLHVGFGWAAGHVAGYRVSATFSRLDAARRFAARVNGCVTDSFAGSTTVEVQAHQDHTRMPSGRVNVAGLNARAFWRDTLWFRTWKGR